MPRWSPDGRRLAFASNRDGDHKQLYVLPLDGGEPLCLTDLKEDVEQPAWSPDGTRIAFASRVPEPGVRGEGREEAPAPPVHPPPLQARQRGMDGRPPLPPVRGAGRRIRASRPSSPRGVRGPARVVSRRRSGSRSSPRATTTGTCRPPKTFTSMDAEGGEPARPHPDDGYYELPVVVARRLRVAYLCTPAASTNRATTAGRRSWTWRRASGASSPRTLDRNCGPYPAVREPLWDGERLLFAVEDDGNTHSIACRPTGGDARARWSAATWWVTGFDAAGGVVVHAAATPTTPTEIFVGDRPLTEVGKALRGRRRASRSERFVGDFAGRRRRWRRGSSARHGFEAGQALPAPAQHPRRAVHAVRQQVLRRVPGRTRRRATPSSTRTPAARPATARSGAAPSAARSSGGTGWGWRRLRGPHGGHGRGARAVRLHRSRPPRRDGRVVRRLHDVVDRRPHRPVQGGGARSGP